jgi:hypothetical protein
MGWQRLGATVAVLQSFVHWLIVAREHLVTRITHIPNIVVFCVRTESAKAPCAKFVEQSKLDKPCSILVSRQLSVDELRLTKAAGQTATKTGGSKMVSRN